MMVDLLFIYLCLFGQPGSLGPDQYQGSQKLVIRILRSQVEIVFIKFIYYKKNC